AADAPRAIAGTGGECGAIRACGAELSRVTRIPDGAPAPRKSVVGADWTKDLDFASPLARDVACVDSLVTPTKLGGCARVACSIVPSRATGKRAPALIAP